MNRGGEIVGDILLKITQHPVSKYTLWLMTDKTAPQAGQIAPALSHQKLRQRRAAPSKTG
jgi:hypothetical protein